MSDPSLVEREAEAISSLERLCVERARAEEEIDRGYRTQVDAQERAFQQAIAKLTQTAQAEIDTTEARYQSVREELTSRYKAERTTLEAEYNSVKTELAKAFRSTSKSLKRAHEESNWQVLAVFEASKNSAIKEHKERVSQLDASIEQLESIKVEAERALVASRRYLAPAELTRGLESPPAESTQPLEELGQKLRQAEEELIPLLKLTLPHFLQWKQFVWPFLILVLALIYPVSASLGWVIGPAIVLGSVVGLAIGSRVLFASVARRQVHRAYPPFLQTLAEADAFVEQSRRWIASAFERQKAAIEERRQAEANKADETLKRSTEELERRHTSDAQKTEAKYPPKLKELEERFNQAIGQANERYPKRLTELKEKLTLERNQLEENQRQLSATTKQTYQQAWDELVTRWQQGLAHVDQVAGEVNALCDRQFLNWHETEIASWEPPTSVPQSLRFGQFDVELERIPDGPAHDPRLKSIGPGEFSFPALLSFPSEGSMLLKAHDAGKAEATRLLQAMMLRYLTSIPPGKVRFTIIDPVGLGENFAAFMHLGDYHELLVNSRIWTEAAHIEQRLADLQAHMENVIQKYLRNEFETIADYNIHAGEVAEPYRVLVVANFPANFNDSAIRRLMSIATSGARCGVYTLISQDTKLPLPSGCQIKDLEALAVNLYWKDGRLQWRDRNFSRFALQLDAPPEQETFSEILHLVGDRARDANRVEVPFEFIAPSPEDYWTSSSSSGIDVPLGRAGATKLQHLRLGQGTSQHVLIAGKTGSGKSTLLHALIVNAALRYSPEELELYLIDFKKGVEFKVYAALELPHARVIAVESEREFGLSVLQRLDGELKVRGDRFRELGVQDLKGYRQVPDQPPLPRILLIVDEFQEFFVEDDKIAQDTALMLDRLVRQGRAFGIHVHLGSQTLGGAFSLARSTLGQMAVRVALQCSESDAHLILSEDNSAARLLTRPGEAIYNDANGLMEGNHFFQVVWLSDDRKEAYLRTIRDLARAQNRPPAQQIVFEGNLPAVAARNDKLARLLLEDEWPDSPKADQAWLGDAIAIKDPTAAVFRPQSGSNLLIVGQNDLAALGMISTAIVSLAAQRVPADELTSTQGVQFYLLDGSPADSLNAGVLGGLDAVVPHTLKQVAWRDLASSITELAAEVERRQKDAGEAAAIYLVVFDLQRFRDLRKGEDDFGFSRYGEEKETPPSKLFVNILRDGPAVGVHTIVWCDSLNNLNRTFDRSALKEFEVRVLFQMSANDSSTLIDSPVAGRLGPHRALYFSEEEGRLEKFRPYGRPTPEWLSHVKERLQGRELPVASNPLSSTETEETDS